MVAKKVLYDLSPVTTGQVLISHRLQEAEEGLARSLSIIAKSEETEWRAEAYRAMSSVTVILFAERMLDLKERLDRVMETVAAEMKVSDAFRVLSRLKKFADELSTEESKRLILSVEILFNESSDPATRLSMKTALRSFEKIDWQWVLFQAVRLLVRVGKLKGWPGAVASAVLIIIHQLSRLFK